MSQYFEEFERVYPAKYQKTHGFWRPVIRRSIDRFIKCGDLKEGFARVKCTACNKEGVPFSCRQRCCCPSCHQKRVLLLAFHLGEDVIAPVAHRQFVFTIPKRFRIYFRFNRSLLGGLSKAAWETVRDVFMEECECENITPAMITGIQTFGDLINWHPHVHAIVPCGIFMKNDQFVSIDGVATERFLKVWKQKIFDLLLREEKITPELVNDMGRWKHSGFSVDQSVVIPKGDDLGMQRITPYMARCPFSLSRIIKLTDEGNVLYRTGKSKAIAFPLLGNDKLATGMKRNFEVFKPLDFLAEVTQHIPNRGEHQLRYYGWYSNKSRGQRAKKEAVNCTTTEEKKARKITPTWAMLIRCIFEVDPLKCPDCGENMKIIWASQCSFKLGFAFGSFIEKKQPMVLEKILRHCGLWVERQERAPPEKERRLVEVEGA